MNTPNGLKDHDKIIDGAGELANEFERALGEEYLTSEDAIVETIQANEYEFTEEGELI